MSSVMKNSATRDALLRRLSQLARRALFGTLSETYRTCGRPGCRCQQGQKHGPHLYVSFRGPSGTTTGYYVPQALAEAMRGGRSEEHTSELQSRPHLVCRLLLEKKNSRLELFLVMYELNLHLTRPLARLYGSSDQN